MSNNINGCYRHSSKYFNPTIDNVKRKRRPFIPGKNV
jgi:hypothetical protein